MSHVPNKATISGDVATRLVQSSVVFSIPVGTGPGNKFGPLRFARSPAIRTPTRNHGLNDRKPNA